MKRILAAILLFWLCCAGICSSVAQGIVTEEDILCRGLSSFANLQEVEDSAMNFIPYAVRSDPSNTNAIRSDASNTIRGSCIFLGRVSIFSVRLPTTEDTFYIAGVATSVVPVEAEAFYHRLLEAFTKKWGTTFDQESFRFYGHGLDEQLLPYSGQETIQDILSGNTNEPIWIRYRLGGVELPVYGFMVGRLGKEIAFITQFIDEEALASPPIIYDKADTVFFRSTQWGMSYDEVNARESMLLTSDSNLGYPVIEGVEVEAGFIADAHYAFGEEGLYWAGYDFHQQHDDPDDSVKDYLYLKAQLVSRYGDPAAEMITLNDWQQPSGWIPQGEDVASGQAKMISRFQVGNTNIVLSLESRFGKISLVQNYHDRTYLPYIQPFPMNPGM